ncbi:hypothetical protein F3Y22_tig00113721pilonHSYRG00196 [Hibiscus syriacus]|uniref:Uncharacterized protein n=1 Tax=Hibiscus syriacus TaxID=106335 RepID=A0A6A2XUM0_HIBSY|nr:hypothetical protein F3Y22_tig00113721pilonHSYRG00196 [Hibiscus syriacus]
MEKKLKESNGRAAVSHGTRTPLRNNRSPTGPGSSKEVASLREKIKLLEGQIKLKETALETSTIFFLEKEQDLQKKIDDLESRVEELNKHSASFYEYELHKVVKDTKEAIESNGVISDGNLKERNDDDSLPVKEQKACVVDRDNSQDELIEELAALKERNKSMESELRDMQERYSEISLKFAEVEGERQRLVMTVRKIKTAKKS